MIKDIAHICIGAHDLEATERFYCEGLKLSRRFNFLNAGPIAAGRPGQPIRTA